MYVWGGPGGRLTVRPDHHPGLIPLEAVHHASRCRPAVQRGYHRKVPLHPRPAGARETPCQQAKVLQKADLLRGPPAWERSRE